MAELYLFRHGIAEDRVAGRDDEGRRLTGKGRKKLERVLRAARAMGARPAVIISSPLIRAVQTAEVAADILGGTLEHDPALSPGSTADALVQAARARWKNGPVMLVGHQPLLGETASFLLHAGA